MSGMVRDEVERKCNDADDRTVTIWRTCPQGIDPQQNCLCKGPAVEGI